jgi:hypothetical protein
MEGLEHRGAGTLDRTVAEAGRTAEASEGVGMVVLVRAEAEAGRLRAMVEGAAEGAAERVDEADAGR